MAVAFTDRARPCTFEPVDSLEARGEYERLCTEEHHTYFVEKPPMPLPQHEVHFPWGFSLRFPGNNDHADAYSNFSTEH